MLIHISGEKVLKSSGKAITLWKHSPERREQLQKIARNLKYFYATGPWSGRVNDLLKQGSQPPTSWYPKQFSVPFTRRFFIYEMFFKEIIISGVTLTSLAFLYTSPITPTFSLTDIICTLNTA